MMVRLSGILVISPSSTKNKQKNQTLSEFASEGYILLRKYLTFLDPYMLEHHVKEFETFDLILVNWCGDGVTLTLFPLSPLHVYIIITSTELLLYASRCSVCGLVPRINKRGSSAINNNNNMPIPMARPSSPVRQDGERRTTFFGRVCFPPCPFFLVLAHFSLCYFAKVFHSISIYNNYIYLTPVKTQLLQYNLTRDLMLFYHSVKIKA